MSLNGLEHLFFGSVHVTFASWRFTKSFWCCFYFQNEEGLGFNVMGGREQNSPIYISRIIPGGVADRFVVLFLLLTVGHTSAHLLYVHVSCSLIRADQRETSPFSL